MKQLLQEVKEGQDKMGALKDRVAKRKSEIIDLEGAIKSLAQQIRQLERGIVMVDFNLLEKRIKEFMEGWKEFLFGFYANQRADNMSREANQFATQWMQQRRSKS